MLLFLLTGSVVLPLKALVLNVFSLTRGFRRNGVDLPGRPPRRLGTTSTGTLVANMPVLLFCIAFGLSMDYEVFLVSRIREYWLASDDTRADNDESVALGVARTGRVVTAAALVMSISFAALIAAQVSFMRMFGVGPDAGRAGRTRRWCAWCWCPRSCTSWAPGAGGRPMAGPAAPAFGISEGGAVEHEAPVRQQISDAATVPASKQFKEGGEYEGTFEWQQLSRP